jgi:hypothetical protein
MELLAFHLHRLGAARAKAVSFVSDGAPWIWNRLDWVVGRAGLDPKRTERVLDCCHAAHHVSLALLALGLAEPERTATYRRANAPNFRHFRTTPAGDTPRPTRLSTASP